MSRGVSRQLIPLFLALLVGAAGCDDLKPITSAPPTPPPAAPSAPGPVEARAEPGAVTLSWSPPENDGGSALTGYRVQGEPQEEALAIKLDGATARVTGLRAGATYRFSVTAVNKAGEGPASVSESVTLPEVPGAPPQPSVVRGDGQVRVSWTEPGSDGRSPVTGYLVTAHPQDVRVTAGASARSVVVEGLRNGEPSTFTVRALNAVGEGPDSPASPDVVPAAVPSAPASVEATADIRQATVTWSAPASTGGLSVQAYVVTAEPGGASREVDADSRGVTFSGLENGTAYTFSVAARNEVGEGPALLSASVRTLGVPSQPGAVSATPGTRSATVTWEAPAEDGGKPLTGYVVEASPSGARLTLDTAARSATFTGLNSTQAHTFTVSALNAVGQGAPSTSSALRPLPAPAEVTELQLESSDAGCLTVSYSLRQPDGVRADVSVEVDSSGSGSFSRATQANGLAADGSSLTHEGTRARPSSPEGRAHQFRWNRSLDVPGAATVRVRLSARVPGTLPGSATLERTLPAAASSCELRLPTTTVQALTATPSRVVSGDVNGDGRLDVVVVPDSGETVSVLLGLGNGSFRRPYEQPLRGSPKRLTTGDLNGDGRDELLWMDTSGYLRVTREYGEPASYPLGSASLSETSTRPIAIADFDGNGSPDVATLGGSGSSFPFLGLLANTGDGTLGSFTPKVYVARDALLEVADLDEDGRMDVLAIGRNWFGSVALLSNGDGSFRSRIIATPSIPSTSAAHALTVGDLDGDGHTDLVLAWKEDSANRVQVHLLRGDGQGGFSAAELVGSLTDSSLTTMPLALAAVDMDHDGLKDLAVGLYGLDYYTLAVLRSRGAEGFAPVEKLPAGRASLSATTGDFDGDGREDLAMVHAYSKDVRVWRSGPGALSLPEGPAGTIAQGDFNGDGKLDFIRFSEPKSVQVYLAGGPDGPRAQTPMLVGSWVYRMVVGQVDEDSALDVVLLSGESANKTVGLLLGNGDGTFRLAPSILVGGRPSTPPSVM
ncbi:Fibronectin, type III domain protein [Archangium gephyra]|uniref:Fibronectin, type III domain protein n=1 Tax=Archangium gephyra TaxID=48 RepID=A0AAC8QHD1_9BACT|nr:Fibronectin, type III domain protein [Archangium gephyra]